MSKVVKPITITLSVMDTLTLIESLNYMIRDEERHELDRHCAERLKKRIYKEVEEGCIEIDLED